MDGLLLLAAAESSNLQSGIHKAQPIETRVIENENIRERLGEWLPLFWRRIVLNQNLYGELIIFSSHV